MNFSAVLLAAGTSSRMQGRHKLLLPYGDACVIRHVAERLLAAGPAEVVVVTGHRGREVMQALAGLPLAFQPNPRYEEGQPTSVAAGCAALRKPCDAVMVCLGDMVLLEPGDYRALADAWARSERAIVVPFHAGERGNPVVFAAALAAEVIAGRRNPGCRKLIAEHPDEVEVFEAPHERYTTDLDTPEDYARLCAQAEAGRAAVAKVLA